MYISSQKAMLSSFASSWSSFITFWEALYYYVSLSLIIVSLRALMFFSVFGCKRYQFASEVDAYLIYSGKLQFDSVNMVSNGENSETLVSLTISCNLHEECPELFTHLVIGKPSCFIQNFSRFHIDLYYLRVVALKILEYQQMVALENVI